MRIIDTMFHTLVDTLPIETSIYESWAGIFFWDPHLWRNTCQIFVFFFGPKSFLLSSVQCPRTSKIKLQSYHLSAALRGRSAVVFRGIVKRRVGIDPQLADNVFDVQVLLRRVPDDEACGMLTCAVWQCWLPTHPGTCNVRPEIAKCIIFYHDIIFLRAGCVASSARQWLAPPKSQGWRRRFGV